MANACEVVPHSEEVAILPSSRDAAQKIIFRHSPSKPGSSPSRQRDTRQRLFNIDSLPPPCLCKDHRKELSEDLRSECLSPLKRTQKAIHEVAMTGDQVTE